MKWKALLGIFKIKRIVRNWFGEKKLDYPDADLVIGTQNIREYTTRAYSCTKEPETCAWLSSLPKEGVFYDVGANVGAYTLIAAARGMEVIAVEPNPLNAGSLHENLVRNNLRGNCTIMSCVLGEKSGRLRVSIPDDTSGATAGYAKEDGNVPFPMYSLDDLVGVHGLPAPTAMKIDVDGAEMLVLSGAKKVLANPLLKHLLVEVDPDQYKLAISFVEKYGLSVAEEHNRGKGVRNIIFTRHELS